MQMSGSKIAFCFLIYDGINQEELWNHFFTGIDPNRYSIYIHYKTNAPLKYFETYKLDNCIDTKWADISLVQAQNLLLARAIQDAANAHFVFLSGACVPLKSFDQVARSLDADYSYFNLAPKSACATRSEMALNFIDDRYIQKAAQWCILNRKHTALLLDNTEYLQWFAVVPDEHCYITMLFYKGLQDELIMTPNLERGATTFTNWSGRRSNPKTYYSISDEELRSLYQSKSLFGRKFATECKLKSLSEISA